MNDCRGDPRDSRHRLGALSATSGSSFPMNVRTDDENPDGRLSSRSLFLHGAVQFYQSNGEIAVEYRHISASRS
jgi:hypothetical protein